MFHEQTFQEEFGTRGKSMNNYNANISVHQIHKASTNIILLTNKIYRMFNFNINFLILLLLNCIIL